MVGAGAGAAGRAVALLGASDELVLQLAGVELAGEQIADDTEAEECDGLRSGGFRERLGHGISGSGSTRPPAPVGRKANGDAEGGRDRTRAVT